MEKIFLYPFTNAAAISWCFFPLAHHLSFFTTFLSSRSGRNYVILCGRKSVFLRLQISSTPVTTATLNMRPLSTHWAEGKGAECPCRVDCPVPWSLKTPTRGTFYSAFTRDEYSGPIPRVWAFNSSPNFFVINPLIWVLLGHWSYDKILTTTQDLVGLPLWLSGKESTCNAEDTGYSGSIPGSGRSPCRRAWQPTPVFLPGESYGQRSLAGFSLSGSQRVKHDWSDWMHTHTHIHTQDLVVLELFQKK